MDILTFVRNLSNEAKQFTDLFEPQWEARKDVSKVIVSITSATQVFTITFAATFLKRETLWEWQYLFIACWIAFVAALILSLLFLYFSINLRDLPARISSRFKSFEAAAQAQPDTEPVHTVFDEEWKYIGDRDKLCTRLFHASLICFGLGIAALTSVGVRQLLTSLH